MKPIHLTLEGIRSYTTVQDIDFERLSDYGVFGITGATGSGKSSIIDAIIIALYGYSGKDFSEFVNLSSPSAKISFTFESESIDGRKRYLIERTYHTNKTPTKSFLYDLTANNECIAATPTECNDRIAKIIGLGREEFVNCVILEQNKYSRFLTSAPRDRKEIIGKIFSLDKYGKPLIDAVKRKVIELKNYINLNEEVIKSKGNISEQNIQDNQAAQQENSKLIEQATMEEKLAQAALSAALADRNTAANAVNLDEKINRANLDLSKAQASLKQAADKHSAMVAEHERNLPQLTAHIDKLNIDINNLEDIIRTVLPAFKEAEKNYNQLVEDYRTQHANQQRNQQQITDGSKALTESDNTIADLLNRIHILTGKGLSNDNNLEVNLLNLRHDYKALLTAQKDKDAHDKVIKDATEEINRLRTIADKHLALRNQLTAQAEQMRNDITSAMRSNAVSLVRHTTKDGEPCPVCGGVYHSQALHSLSQTTDDDKLAAMEQAHSQLIADRNAANQEYSHTSNLIVAETQKISTATARITELAKTFDKYQALGFVLPTTDQVDQEIEQFFEKAEQQASLAKDLRSKIELLRSKAATQAAVIEGLTTSGKAAKAHLDDLKSRIDQQLGGKDAATLLSNLKAKRELLKNEVTSLASRLQIAEQELNKEKTQLNGIQSQLNVLTEERTKLPKEIKTISDEDFENLNSRVKKLSDMVKTLLIESGKLETQHNSLVNDLAQITELKAQNQVHEKSLRLYTELDSLVGANRFMEYICNEYITRFTGDASELLLSLTNGQFALKYYDTTAKSGFYIVDYLNSGLERKATTASGGETFLVALSLAVSISRTLALRSNAASVEFLFIDEGFGTLDSELVDTVMDALDKLKSGNFTIGLISHRAEIQSRLPLKITVEKTQDGSVIY